MNKLSTKISFIIISIFFLLSAASVWAVPAAFDAEGNMKPIGYAAGILFWAGLLGGLTGYLICLKQRHQKPALLKFFSNKPAKAADGMFLFSLAALIIVSGFVQVGQTVEIVLVFLLLLSIYGHFLLNGRLFSEILTENKKRKGVTEG